MTATRLAVGARLGPYEITGILGAGGMGEVYRARDTNLARDVAIKVLPETLADDPTRLMRFEREARALAALNHPNIATVYAIHDRAIVMELVEGEDLSVRLRRGRMPLAEILPIARQVAEALGAAHDAGIVHRDLKPANIKLRDDGTIKVLDFGLAKGGSAEADASNGASSGSGSADLPPTETISPEMTAEGRVLGTAAYMSPEQAKGRLVDKRTDIWAFGAVLFEMLAGRRPFSAAAGLDAADTMARILATEPEWRALPADTPAGIRRLLSRCLQKERKQRLHDIADARIEIDDALASPVAHVQPVRRYAWGVALVLASLAIGGVVATTLWRPPASDPAVTHARLDVSPAAEINAAGTNADIVLPAGGARTALAWSPDGRTLAFIGQQGGKRLIYVRDLAADVARPLGGTDGALTLAFSPDGRQIAFWVEHSLMRVNLAGGPPVRICYAADVAGMHWGATHLVFSQGSLWFVDPSAPGSEGTQLSPVQQDLIRVASPFLLPGDKAVLYTEYQKQWTSGDERVMVMPLSPGAAPKVLLRQAADARYLATGHIAFLRQGTLFVVPFNADTLELTGQPTAVVNDVSQSAVAWDSNDLTLEGQFSISPQGHLAYVSSPLPRYPDRELVNVSRTGAIRSLGAPIKGYRNRVDLSPDGTRLAVSIQTVNDVHLYELDIARGTLARIAEPVPGELNLAAWSRDDRIALQLIDGGKESAAIVRPDVASPALHVPDTDGYWPASWAPDGTLAGMRNGDIWFFRPGRSGDTPTHLPNTPRQERQAAFSPDGRWIAYSAETTGRSEVYVRPYPGPGEAALISTDGGSGPAWSPDGRELFYLEPGVEGGHMVVASMHGGQSGKPARLFPFENGTMFLGTGVLTPYAVARDGRSFYAIRQVPRSPSPVTQLTVVINWFEELRAKAGK